MVLAAGFAETVYALVEDMQGEGGGGDLTLEFLGELGIKILVLCCIVEVDEGRGFGVFEE